MITGKQAAAFNRGVELIYKDDNPAQRQAH